MVAVTKRNGWLPGARRSVGLFLLVASLLAVAGCVQVQAGDGAFAVGNDIVVRRGDSERDDVVVVGGNVRIEGRARRDVVVIGGRLEINGEVGGSVSCVAGTLILGPGARVNGDVVAVAASLRRSDSARIDGEFVNVSIDSPFDGWVGGPVFVPWAWGLWWPGLSVGFLVLWLLGSLVTIALVGDRVSSASHSISRDPLRLWAIGVFGLLCLTAAHVVSLVLWLLLIGIPITLFLLFLGFVAYIFGVVAVFQAVGTRVVNAVGRPEASQTAIILVGCLVAYGLTSFVPILGFFLWWFVIVPIAIGSVFATRFGTGRPWMRRASPVPPGGSHAVPPPGAPSVAPPVAPEGSPASPPPVAPDEGPVTFDEEPGLGEITFEPEPEQTAGADEIPEGTGDSGDMSEDDDKTS